MKKSCSPDQLSFFGLLKDLRPKNIDFSSFNIDLKLRGVVSQAIRECPKKRFTIAIEMSEVLGIEITASMIDAWTAESREGLNRFPAAYLPAFCHVVGSIEPLRVLADLVGCFVIQGEEALDLEMKRIEDQEKVLSDKKRAIKTIRNGIGK
jgi:hypothetical protein